MNALFPMNYTLAFDKDGNGVFDMADEYFYGQDASAPSIDITNLAYGRYKLIVGSSAGCNLKSFDFFIFNCYGVVLSLSLESFAFKGTQNNEHKFACSFKGNEKPASIWLERGDGTAFTNVSTASIKPIENNRYIISAPVTGDKYYRLRYAGIDGKEFYSSTIQTPVISASNNVRYYPNPAEDYLYIQIETDRQQKGFVEIVNSAGMVVDKRSFDLSIGLQAITIPTAHLLRGVYQIVLPFAPTQRVRFYKR
jgi:hypothetical protein